ncbi:MAG: type I-B CRISPR-associated protein Cas5b [Candidatus Aenigmatarchaeota archaeon]
MKILRINIYQPHAHYRIPYSMNRRLTYPIPPYSTVIGFLCNISGINDQRKSLYETIKNLKISIAGKFDTKVTEYVWFRNLAKTKHIKYYFSPDIRSKNGQIGHIGGQSPVKIDVLENMELFIYLYHEREDEIVKIKQKLENPDDRLQPIHLGRAEDWIVIKDIKILGESDILVKKINGLFDYFFWVPEKMVKFDGVDIDWDKVEGNIYYLTTLSKIQDYEKHYNHAEKKIYKKIRAKLSEGKMKNISTLFDKDMYIPIFLGEME